MRQASGPIYIGEVAPADTRGKIMTFWQLFYSVGSFICFWIAYATNLHKEKLGHWDWRLIVIFQVLVPIIICILLPFQPESPRWWIQRHNNIDEAKKAMMMIRETEQEAEEELLLIREAIEYEKEATSGRYFALFRDPSIRKRLYLVFILNVMQQLSGQGTLNTYSS
ncbi:MFS transporter [Candidatus Bathyarchaeota archaeon]|nr:MFS transporter [Candidatus Bathyarchaeota archaeon]